jgi:L,D-peptidoglycan transpeptidase YkuD (ErfK/YbiS/YcfS/YnhG family)
MRPPGRRAGKIGADGVKRRVTCLHRVRTPFREALMTDRSGPSTTRIVLTLAAIAVGGTLALFAVGAVVSLVSSPPAAKLPARAVATTQATSTVVSAPAKTPAPVATAPLAAATADAIESRTSVRPHEITTATGSAAKPAAKPPTKPKARHIAALPDRLKTLGGARQVVVVTSAGKSERDGLLELFNLNGDGNWIRVMSATTRMGRNAMVEGTARHQGSSTTPTGSWAMPTWGFGWADSAPSGSHMGWRQIRSDSYWSAEQDSTYNTWVSSSSGVSGEHLRSMGASYEFAIDSGFNAPPNPRVYGRGTAIFIHVMHEGYTAGCISIPRAKMVELLTKLDPARHPRCVVATKDAGSSTSLSNY